MKTKNAMQLKAVIKNKSKELNISPQLLLQNYYMECFIDRLSRSEYADRFIIKGGFLISSLVGLDNRSTMDIDTTVKNRLSVIESSSELQGQWSKYQKKFPYAKSITYKQTVDVVKEVIDEIHV